MMQAEKSQSPSSRKEGSITHFRVVPQLECGVVRCGGFVESFQQDKEKKVGTDEIRTREVSHHGLDRA